MSFFSSNSGHPFDSKLSPSSNPRGWRRIHFQALAMISSSSGWRGCSSRPPVPSLRMPLRLQDLPGGGERPFGMRRPGDPFCRSGSLPGRKTFSVPQVVHASRSAGPRCSSARIREPQPNPSHEHSPDTGAIRGRRIITKDLNDSLRPRAACNTIGSNESPDDDLSPIGVSAGLPTH